MHGRARENEACRGGRNLRTLARAEPRCDAIATEWAPAERRPCPKLSGPAPVLAQVPGRRYFFGVSEEGSFMLAVIQVVLLALDILWWIIIASAVLSWLYAFNVVNPRNAFIGSVGDFLYRATEPLYRPIRRSLPNLGGLDLSPLVVLLGIFFVRQLLIIYAVPAVFRAGI